jgi:hypothetical protein
MTIQTFVFILAVILVVVGFVSWLIAPRKLSPDPWGPEATEALRNPDIAEVCHRCFTPCPSIGWFCPTCGASVGPYNNYMPYIHVFSEGEVLRAGVTAHIRRSALTIGGYLLCSITSYLLLAPLYWYFLFRNLRRHDKGITDESGSET